MSDISKAGGGSAPLSHQDKLMYQSEYRQGVKLFERAAKEYTGASEIHQKEAFKDVMDQALQVLNDAAAALKRPDLMDQNAKIATDYEEYQKDPTQAGQLTADLKKASESLG